nr:sodium/proline symporter [Haloprofundus halobius]
MQADVLAAALPNPDGVTAVLQADGIAGTAGTWVLVTFAAYLLILIGIGLYTSRFMDTVGDYVIGGRRIGPVVTGFSERASEMSGWLTLGVPGDAYSTGIMAFLNGLGMIPADLFAWAGIAKRLRKYTEIVRAVTLPTFFEYRLGDDTGMVKGVSSVVLMLFEGGYVGAQIVAAGTLLEVLTGVDTVVGILVGGVIVIGYTFLGGYFAVAWSDYFQGAIILIAFIILPVVAFANYGLPFEEVAATAGSSFTSITAGMTGWAALFGIISYAAIGLGVPGNPHIMVRFMGIDRVKNIRTAALVAQLFMFVAYIGAALVGLYALAVFGQGGVTDIDNAMPRLTLELLPGVVAGIVLAAALAAMMSSADSQLLVATSAVVEDVYHGFFNEDATEEQLVRYSRIVTFVLGGASVAFAFAASGTPIYTLVLDYAWGGLGAAIGPTVIAALWWKRVTAEGSVASMVVGAVTMIGWTQLETILGMMNAMPSAEASPFLSGLVGVYGLFPAFVLSVLTLIVVSLLTRPPEGVDDDFDVFEKPLSAVVSDRQRGGTPDYVTDGGRDRPKAVTEADNIRAHVAASGYWRDGAADERTGE